MNALCRTSLVPHVALAVLLVASLSALRPVSAQSDRTVTASARCLDVGASGQPEVEATLTNHSGAPLTVSDVHGITSGQAFVPMMRTVPPEPMPPVVVADGATETITAPWDDLGDPPGFLGSALIVTSAGPLVPACSERPVDADELYLGPAPRSADEARREAVTIAVQTLGRLESWRAYPALYDLLHPDAQAEVPFAALACWYAAELGLPTDPLETFVFGNTVRYVTFRPWTWVVTDQTYPDAAQVNYTRSVGTLTTEQRTPSTMHLVEVNGQWRWFFGTSRDALNALPTDCDLSGDGS